MNFIKSQYLFFTTLTIIFMIFSYFYLDITIAKYFITHKHEYDKIGKILSIGGQSKWYISVSIIGFFTYKFYKKNEVYAQRFLFLFYINIFSSFITLILKIIVGRMRPWGLENGNHQYGLFFLFKHINFELIDNLKHHLRATLHSLNSYVSFPSGHATTAFVMFTFMSLLFPKYKYLWFFLAFIIALSRLFADDHFLSDIVGGALVGILSSLYIYKKMVSRLRI